jgi:hypothetical protein
MTQIIIQAVRKRQTMKILDIITKLVGYETDDDDDVSMLLNLSTTCSPRVPLSCNLASSDATV